MKGRGQGGFSLVEVLVAAAILSIGLVSVLVLIRYQARESVAIAARRIALSEIRDRLAHHDPTSFGPAWGSTEEGEKLDADQTSPEALDPPWRIAGQGPWLPAEAYPGSPLPLELVLIERPWKEGGRAGVVAVPLVVPSQPKK